MGVRDHVLGRPGPGPGRAAALRRGRLPPRRGRTARRAASRRSTCPSPPTPRCWPPRAGRIAAVAASPTTPAAVVVLDPGAGPGAGGHDVVRVSAPAPDPAHLPVPQPARGPQRRAAHRPRPPLPPDPPRPPRRRPGPARPVRPRRPHRAVAGRVLPGGRVLHLPRPRGRRRPVRRFHRLRPRLPRGPRRQLGGRGRGGLRRRRPLARRGGSGPRRAGRDPRRQRGRVHRPGRPHRDRRLLRRAPPTTASPTCGRWPRRPTTSSPATWTPSSDRCPRPRPSTRSARRCPTSTTCPARCCCCRGPTTPWCRARRRRRSPQRCAARGCRTPWSSSPASSTGSAGPRTSPPPLEAELSFYGQVWGFDPPGVPRLTLS